MMDKDEIPVDPNLLDLLLAAKPPKLEKELEMTRLSAELGTKVVFKIRALSYRTVAEFIQGKDDAQFFIVLEGLVSPDIKDDRLLRKYGAATPLELLKDIRFLLPGEVEELSLHIERFSGYRASAFKELEKN